MKRTIIRTTAGGLGGLLLVLGALAINARMTATVDPETAEHHIRMYLRQRAAVTGLEGFLGQDAATPDAETAASVQQDLRAVDALEFVSIKIKHFLLPPPVTTTRIFVVKAVLRDPSGVEQTRYFTLSAKNNVFDFFWVAEKSGVMWLFSV